MANVGVLVGAGACCVLCCAVLCCAVLCVLRVYVQCARRRCPTPLLPHKKQTTNEQPNARKHNTTHTNTNKGLLETDEDGWALRATDAGRLMVAHYVRLGTMRAIVGQGSHRSAPDLLGVISRAEEVVGAVVLRRCERWL